MRHFILQRCVHLALYATLARYVVACGADTDHGPPIGSPTGPSGPVVSEAGASARAGAPGNQNTGGASVGTTSELGGGTFNSATGGTGAFGTGGDGSAGRDQFGVGGSGPGTNPFGAGGSVSASFGGSPF